MVILDKAEDEVKYKFNILLSHKCLKLHPGLTKSLSIHVL